MRFLTNQHQWAHGLAQLSRALGRQSAAVELRWMMHAIALDRSADHRHVSDTLSVMIARRVSGEPLQYILGE